MTYNPLKMSKKILFIYSSVDGHTLKICKHMMAKNKSLASVIGQLPRFFIEGVAFGGMIILTLLMMIRGNGFANIVPIIALYTFAGYRLMPALQQIYASVTQLRFSNSTLNALHKDLMSLKYKKNLKKI